MAATQQRRNKKKQEGNNNKVASHKFLPHDHGGTPALRGLLVPLLVIQQ